MLVTFTSCIWIRFFSRKRTIYSVFLYNHSIYRKI
nr:MAG TPA: hypothetical protein [Caudoviricetes sp.]